jgi:arginine deiminase
LRDHGTQVLYVKPLLLTTLICSEKARHALIDGIIEQSLFNIGHQQEQILIALRKWLLARKPEQLVEDVIVGVAYSQDELGTSPAAQTLLNIGNFNNQFLIPPLPNLLFSRDAFSIIEKNVFIWRMAKSARRNEPLIIRVIFQYHPQLSTSGLKIVEWQTSINDHELSTIEGGDVAYIGEGILLIGCSERTNRAGIEALARTDLFRQVIAVMIPPQRDYMHLDTVLSSVGKHAFTLHGRLANIMEVFTVETHDINHNIYPKPEWISHGCDIRQALRNLLNDSELKFYDAQDEETSIYEQGQCRHNVFALDNYHVVTYAGGDLEKGVIAEMTRNNDCQVGLIPNKGLIEGGGGVHCMTNAIRRRAK